MVIAHGVQICSEAMDLVMVHDQSGFWEIRRKDDRKTAECVISGTQFVLGQAPGF